MKSLKIVLIAAVISTGALTFAGDHAQMRAELMSYKAHAEYHTGQALANILSQNCVMTEQETKAFTDGLHMGLMDIAINEDIPIMKFAAQTFVEERSKSDAALQLDERSESTVNSDRIKAKLLGYVVGVSFTHEMGLNDEEAAKLSLGFEDQSAYTVTNVGIAQNKSARKFIIERTASQHPTIPELRVTQKLLMELNREIFTNQS